MKCPYCSEGEPCHVCGGTLYLPPGFVKNEESAPEQEAPEVENGEAKPTKRSRRSGIKRSKEA